MKRSQRWAERPSNVLVLSNTSALSDEDKQLLVSLGMAAK